ncbi:hypothetical protein D1007_29262 [Hordeum vulgare]|nr:hypothetical protein D1007_29262 [Hordeum vulgare]
MMLPESSRVSFTQSIPGFHLYPQGSRFFGECSPKVSIVSPSTPASVTIDLNATSVAGGSSSEDMWKRQREMPADMLTGAAVDDDTTNRFLENMIFEWSVPAAGAYCAAAYDPDETQSQDGRAPFTQATNDPHDAFMQDQIGLDDFSLDHEFSEDYDLEEEDDMDIDREPLFEEELANQTPTRAKPKRKSKQRKAYTPTEDKLLLQSKYGWVSLLKHWSVIQQECNKFCATYESIKAHPMSSLGMQDVVFQALEAFKVLHDGKAFHLSHYWTIIKGRRSSRRNMPPSWRVRERRCGRPW